MKNWKGEGQESREERMEEDLKGGRDGRTREEERRNRGIKNKKKERQESREEGKEGDMKGGRNGRKRKGNEEERREEEEDDTEEGRKEWRYKKMILKERTRRLRR